MFCQSIGLEIPTEERTVNGKTVKVQLLPDVKETDLENKIKQFLSNESTKEEVRLAIEQRERLFNIQATERILSHLGNFKDRALGLRSLLVGTVRFARGARKSIDAIGKYHSTKYITSMIYATQLN